MEVDQERAVEYECLRCEARHKEAHFDPRKTVHCKNCGNVAYPMEGHLPKERSERRCRECRTLLRASNHGALCSLCDR
jgi:DNA-directed RNA polymerase subunit RPC12/RpoP